MVLLQDLAERLQAEDPEERLTISGVSWDRVVTSSGLDKLEVYRRLGVREVWF